MSIWERRSDASKDAFTPQKYNAPRTLTASAARVDLKSKKEVDAIAKRRQTDKWQSDAWEYYDLIGEIKASASLVSNVMSRINLYGGFVSDSSSIPSSIRGMEEDIDPEFIQDVEDTLYMLESGNGGTSGLLRNAAMNMFVVGECYLVREPPKAIGDPIKYQVRSVDEIITTSGRKNSQVFIKPRRDSKPGEFLPLPIENGYVCRMWRNHPRYSDEADSSLRGVLDICDQLLLVDHTATATARSRLNAGMLFVPDGLSNLTEPDGDTGEDGDPVLADAMTDTFEEELIEAMTTPVADVSSASAVVPLIVRGPEELGEKIKHIKFERSFDVALAARSEKLLDRILAGLDIPLDVAKGLSGVKYSNAILIDEQLYKAHIEPLILLICDQLTVGFLRPALRHMGWDEKLVSRAVVWYDPSQITAKPSKAEAAVTLYGMGAISLETLRRTNGFSEGDAPTDLEKAQRLAIDRGLLDEQTSAMLFNTIIPQDIQDAAREANLAISAPDDANALSNALGGEAAAPEGAPVEGETEAPAQSTEQAPPTLMEP